MFSKKDELAVSIEITDDGAVGQCASLLVDLCLFLPYLVKMIDCTNPTFYYLVSYIFQ